MTAKKKVEDMTIQELEGECMVMMEVLKTDVKVMEDQLAGLIKALHGRPMYSLPDPAKEDPS